MNTEMTTNSQLSALNLKHKNKLSKQLEQQQNHRYGDYLEGFQRGEERMSMGEKAQGIRSMNGKYKIDRGRLRIECEMEEPRNSYV